MYRILLLLLVISFTNTANAGPFDKFKDKLKKSVESISKERESASSREHVNTSTKEVEVARDLTALHPLENFDQFCHGYVSLVDTIMGDEEARGIYPTGDRKVEIIQMMGIVPLEPYFESIKRGRSTEFNVLPDAICGDYKEIYSYRIMKRIEVDGGLVAEFVVPTEKERELIRILHPTTTKHPTPPMVVQIVKRSKSCSVHFKAFPGWEDGGFGMEELPKDLSVEFLSWWAEITIAKITHNDRVELVVTNGGGPSLPARIDKVVQQHWDHFEESFDGDAFFNTLFEKDQFRSVTITEIDGRDNSRLLGDAECQQALKDERSKQVQRSRGS